MTRTEIIALAKQCGAIDSYPGSNDGIVEFDPDQLEAFFRAAQRAEREACAIECLNIAHKPSNVVLGVGLECAAAIRNRGTNHGL